MCFSCYYCVMNKGIYQSEVANYTCNRGKIRDCYDLGETMMIIVTTDRISAFDYVFPDTLIPDKGVILTKLSNYWAETLDVKYHLISSELNHLPKDFVMLTTAGLRWMMMAGWKRVLLLKRLCLWQVHQF